MSIDLSHMLFYKIKLLPCSRRSKLFTLYFHFVSFFGDRGGSRSNNG